MRQASTAIVTGGSRGLGRELVNQLVARGWNVVFDGRDRATLEKAAHELALSAPRVRAIAPDRFGLMGMRERTKLLGGSFELRTEANAGTEIRVSLPLS